MKEKISKKADEIFEKALSHRRFLHENAETGFDTFITSEYIHNALCQIGIECYFIGKNMVSAKINGGKSGKCILLRADIDGLDIVEETPIPYACKSGKMHACGHDMHSAMLLGAAEILYEMRESLCGCVKLLFQSGEEILSGAKFAIEKGVLDGVDSAMTVHVLTACDFETGKIVLSYDTPSAPSADFFKVTISGIGCHGSSPSTGVDPISCACRIISSLEHIKAYEIGIHDRAVLTVGVFHSGKSANAIAEKAEIAGTLRCFDEDIRRFYKKRFEEIVKGISEALRCQSSIEYTSECPCLINNRDLLEATAKNMTELLSESNVIKIKDTRSRVQGSEDFANISQCVPSVTVAIAAGKSDDGYSYPLHNSKALFDEKALSIGCKVFAYNALKILGG